MILAWICVLLTISSTIEGSPLPQVLGGSNVSGGTYFKAKKARPIKVDQKMFFFEFKIWKPGK